MARMETADWLNKVAIEQQGDLGFNHSYFKEEEEFMRQANQVYVTLTGTRKAQTAKAVLFSVKAISGTPVDLENKDQWFPLSQIQKMTTDPNKVGEDIIMATEWICKEKGLLENAARATKVKQDAHGFDKLETFPDEDFPDEEDPYNGGAPF